NTSSPSGALAAGRISTEPSPVARSSSHRSTASAHGSNSPEPSRPNEMSFLAPPPAKRTGPKSSRPGRISSPPPPGSATSPTGKPPGESAIRAEAGGSPTGNGRPGSPGVEGQRRPAGGPPA